MLLGLARLGRPAEWTTLGRVDGEGGDTHESDCLVLWRTRAAGAGGEGSG